MFARSQSNVVLSSASALLMLVLSIVAGCSGPSSGGDTGGSIGPSGGAVKSDTGARIDIPAGALSDTVDIQIVKNPIDAPAIGSTLSAYGAVFALLPHGTTFSTPVTITIPFDPALVAAGATPKLYKAEPGGTFAEIPATVTGNLLVAQIASFSFVQAQGPGGGSSVASKTITVNTTADIDNPSDGLTTLREAVASAVVGETTEIEFDSSAFFNSTTFAVTPIALEDTLVIPTGVHLVIDGSLVFAGYNMVVTGGNSQRHILTVETGAVVTLRDLKLQGTVEQAAKGTDGPAGVKGAAGLSFFSISAPSNPFTGESGTDGADGTESPGAGSAGGDGVGGILNRGDLTLERVSLDKLEGHGGDGGNGGDGGSGGNGGNGSNVAGPGGPSGSGGNGGNGANASNAGGGGAAAGAILNLGTLLIRDVNFTNVKAVGGRGGVGGDGGDGGVGGDRGYIGGIDATLDYQTGSASGNGGNAGNGGNGGAGGSAAAAIFNIGTVTFDSVQAEPGSAVSTGGFARLAGEAGREGVYGSINAITRPDLDTHHGTSGTKGANGVAALAGVGESFHNTSPQIGNTFIISVARDKVSDTGDINARTISLSFQLLGQHDGSAEVDWSFSGGSGINAADFVSGLPTGGTMVFDPSVNGKSLGFTLNDDQVAEGPETFTITLSNPIGGQLGWSKSITITITD